MDTPYHGKFEQRFISQSGRPTGVLPDWMIRQYVKIEPMAEGEKRPGKISFGLTSYGYDARIGYKFKIFTPALCAVVDPKKIDEAAFVNVDLTPSSTGGHVFDRNNAFTRNLECSLCHEPKERYDRGEIKDCPSPKATKADHILIPPNSYALGETVEYFEIPRDIICVCLGKSTLARSGVIVNVTPLEPEWRGKVTVEISNSTPLPVKVYAGEGICQILFFRGLTDCEKSYQDKGSGANKYQDQQGLTLPKVD